MEHQSIGRIQRPKGTKIKQSLNVVLVLAVCAWLLYQIKHSKNSSTQNYRGQSNFDGGYGAISLGRKGSQMEKRGASHSQTVDYVIGAKYSSSGRDDESNGAKEEFGHIHEQFRTRDGKEVEHESKSESKVSSRNKHQELSKKVDTESRRSESGLKRNDSKINHQEKGTQLREQQKDVLLRKSGRSDFSEKENVEESATNAGMTEETDENVQLESFQDENGVPPDGNETQIVFGQAHVLREAKMSNINSINEVTSGDDSNVEVNSEASKNDATAEEINSGTTITHVDTSGILPYSGTGEEDRLVL